MTGRLTKKKKTKMSIIIHISEVLFISEVPVLSEVLLSYQKFCSSEVLFISEVLLSYQKFCSCQLKIQKLISRKKNSILHLAMLYIDRNFIQSANLVIILTNLYIDNSCISVFVEVQTEVDEG